jgi:hypothetical protein
MFDFIHDVNAATFSNSEPATLYTAARAVYGYKEMLNMAPVPFDYVPRRTPRKGLTALRELFLRHRTPHTPSYRAPRRAVANG